MKRLILATKTTSLAFLAFIVSSSCKKEIVKPEELARVNALIKNDTIIIESEWAHPMNAALINRTGIMLYVLNKTLRILYPSP